jgi:hypothetical protein
VRIPTPPVIGCISQWVTLFTIHTLSCKRFKMCDGSPKKLKQGPKNPLKKPEKAHEREAFPAKGKRRRKAEASIRPGLEQD